MTKAQEATFEAMINELAAAAKAAHDRIDELTALNAALTLRVIELETRGPAPANGIVRDANTGLVNKVPKDSIVVKAARTQNGYYIVLEDGTRHECTEYCAAYWHKRITAVAA